MLKDVSRSRVAGLAGFALTVALLPATAVNAANECASRTISDPVGDGTGPTDVTSARLSLTCSANSWHLQLTAPGNWYHDDIDTVALSLDTDQSMTTGCGGSEFFIRKTYEDPSPQIYRTRACDGTLEQVGAGSLITNPDADTISLFFDHRYIGSPSVVKFRGGLTIGAYGGDAFPEDYQASTVALPGAQVVYPRAAPRAIDSACAEAQIGEDGMSDVPHWNVHERAVDCVVHWRVANGKADGTYGPEGHVTREQMAAFIARTIDAVLDQLPEQSQDHFSDDDDSPHAADIGRLAEARIVSGVAPGTYDPGGLVSRAQMAAFLTRAYDYMYSGGLPIAEDYFPDDDSSSLETKINLSAALGFAGGFGDGTYRPTAPVQRDQMASFLARVLDLSKEDVSDLEPAG